MVTGSLLASAGRGFLVILPRMHNEAAPTPGGERWRAPNGKDVDELVDEYRGTLQDVRTFKEIRHVYTTFYNRRFPEPSLKSRLLEVVDEKAEEIMLRHAKRVISIDDIDDITEVARGFPFYAEKQREHVIAELKQLRDNHPSRVSL